MRTRGCPEARGVRGKALGSGGVRAFPVSDHVQAFGCSGVQVFRCWGGPRRAFLTRVRRRSSLTRRPPRGGERARAGALAAHPLSRFLREGMSSRLQNDLRPSVGRVNAWMVTQVATIFGG